MLVVAWTKIVMDPFIFIERHEYDEALRRYDEMFAYGDMEHALVGRATALMCLFRFDEAIESLWQANKLKTREIGDAWSYHDEIGGLHWLAGRAGSAIEMLLALMDALRKDDVNFADGAGGGRPGMLLWYISVTQNDTTLREAAVEYLQWLENHSRLRLWPYPIVELILGRYDWDRAMMVAAKKSQLPDALRVAKKDVLARRRLSQLVFYKAIIERRGGRESECQALLRVTAEQLENPYEFEWFVARSEIDGEVRE